MTVGVTPLFAGFPGTPELLIVLLVIILLFGANRIPEIARSMGKSIGAFKQGREEIEDEISSIQSGDEDEK